MDAADTDKKEMPPPAAPENRPASASAGSAARSAIASFDLYNGNTELLSEYRTLKKEIATSHTEYIAEHPELRAFLADYMQLLMHRKPEDVYAFTHEYFRV